MCVGDRRFQILFFAEQQNGNLGFYVQSLALRELPLPFRQHTHTHTHNNPKFPFESHSFGWVTAEASTSGIAEAGLSCDRARRREMTKEMITIPAIMFVTTNAMVSQEGPQSTAGAVPCD